MGKKTYKFTNKEISHLLRSVSVAYLLKGENRFKIIAYDNAADKVEHLTRELRDYWQEGQIYNIYGIGSSIASYLDDYFKIGRSKHFDSVLKGIPKTVFELIKVRSIGPKKAYKLIRFLKLRNVKTVFKDIVKACNKGKIAKIPSFGEKSQKNILNEVKIYLKNQKIPARMPLPYALSYAEEICNYLKKNKKVKKIDILGSLRRKTATIGDIDLSVAVRDKDAVNVIDYFIKYPKKNIS